MTFSVELLALILIILLGSRLFFRLLTFAAKVLLTLFGCALLFNGLAAIGVSVIDILELIQTVLPLEGLTLFFQLLRPFKLFI